MPHSESICPLCSLKMRSDNLKRHLLLKHHEAELREFNLEDCKIMNHLKNLDPTKKSCWFCGKYISPSNMSKHLRNIHKADYRRNCSNSLQTKSEDSGSLYRIERKLTKGIKTLYGKVGEEKYNELQDGIEKIRTHRIKLGKRHLTKKIKEEERKFLENQRPEKSVLKVLNPSKTGFVKIES